MTGIVENSHELVWLREVSNGTHNSVKNVWWMFYFQLALFIYNFQEIKKLS